MSVDIKQSECDKCGKSILFSALKMIDELNVGNRLVCGDCVEEYLVCNDCGIYANDGDLTFVNNSDKGLCNDCLNDNYCICDSCDEYYNNDCIQYINNDKLCENCFDNQVTSCSWCNEDIYIEDRINFCGEAICQRCDDNYVIYCIRCEERIHTDDSYGGGYCECCWDEECREQSCSVHYSSSLNYYKLDDEPSPRMYYGIELETGTLKYIDFDNEIINKLSTKYFDRHDDGSIFHNSVKQGIEIVGHPMTYKWMKANPDVWNDVLKLRKKGLCSYKTGSCGIHIHLSKKAFNERHLYKFMKMIYGFPSFTKLISQRTKNKLREWASITGECNEDLKRKAKDKRGGIRYTAVNLTNSHGTVEIRLFRGTLDEMAFWKNIEYIQALLEFTANAKVKELSVKNYLSYVCVKKHEFCNLYNWLKKKGKIKEVKE